MGNVFPPETVEYCFRLKNLFKDENGQRNALKNSMIFCSRDREWRTPYRFVMAEIRKIVEGMQGSSEEKFEASLGRLDNYFAGIENGAFVLTEAMMDAIHQNRPERHARIREALKLPCYPVPVLKVDCTIDQAAEISEFIPKDGDAFLKDCLSGYLESARDLNHEVKTEDEGECLDEDEHAANMSWYKVVSCYLYRQRNVLFSRRKRELLYTAWDGKVEYIMVMSVDAMCFAFLEQEEYEKVIFLSRKSVVLDDGLGFLHRDCLPPDPDDEATSPSPAGSSPDGTQAT